jgi:O6-methylguanine-DNA--protein-cysteine methyltransferase
MPLNKIETTLTLYHLLGTRFGPVVFLWSVHQGQPKIRRVLLSRPGLSAKEMVNSLFPDSTASSCAEIDAVADRMAAFLAGKDIRFSLAVARLDLCSTFQQKVLRAEHGIPRGRVSTYQRIAGNLGHPRAARAVGTALAHNPFPIIFKGRENRGRGSPLCWGERIERNSFTAEAAPMPPEWGAWLGMAPISSRQAQADRLFQALVPANDREGHRIASLMLLQGVQ